MSGEIISTSVAQLNNDRRIDGFDINELDPSISIQ